MSREVAFLKDRVKLARSKRGLTQGALAKAAGLKQPDISKLELGLIQQTTAMARLASALRVPAQWLELGEGPEPDWNVAGTPPPPKPPARFADRHEVSESEWALLQDIKVVLEPEEIDRIRAKARALQDRAMALVEERLAATKGKP